LQCCDKKSISQSNDASVYHLSLLHYGSSMHKRWML
jgi:hypothetical protein